MRKPRNQNMGYDIQVICLPQDGVLPAVAEVTGSSMNAKECRKLAAWLIKAADYLDHQESVKKKRGGVE